MGYAKCFRKYLSIVREFYARTPLNDFGLWKFSQKHFRIELFNHRFNKLHSEIKGKLGINDLRFFGRKYIPLHFYMSVLDYLFPERVSGKRNTKNAYPVGGELVVDIDSSLIGRRTFTL